MPLWIYHFNGTFCAFPQLLFGTVLLESKSRIFAGTLAALRGRESRSFKSWWWVHLWRIWRQRPWRYLTVLHVLSLLIPFGSHWVTLSSLQSHSLWLARMQSRSSAAACDCRGRECAGAKILCALTYLEMFRLRDCKENWLPPAPGENWWEGEAWLEQNAVPPLTFGLDIAGPRFWKLKA